MSFKKLSLFALVAAVFAATFFTPIAAQQGRGAAPVPPPQVIVPQGEPAAQQPNAAWPPLHVYLRVGIKSHGPGQHDYPQFIADWSNLLTERGAIVDGGLHFPTREGVVRRERHRHVQGRRRLHEPPRERATLESFLQARRRARQLPRHTLRPTIRQYQANSSAAPRNTAR